MSMALVFDSGVGGLTVAAEIRALLPDLAMTYVADDEFRPYGNKTEEALNARLPGLLSTLSDMIRPDIVVIACNTASTTALTEIREVLSVPVVGVVPAIKPAAEQSQTKVIGVLGTPGTVRRRYVDGLISEFAGDCEVVLCGSVGLVEMAERKLAGDALNVSDMRADIMPLLERSDLDTVVLACTHFPLLREELTTLGGHINWIDSGAAIARRVKSLLPNIGAKIDEVDTALLIGPNTSLARREAFARYGFECVVALLDG